MFSEWIYTVDYQGETPLGRASRSGHMSLTDLLLRQELEDICQTDAEVTPLHQAAYLGLEEAVATLLEEGFNPDRIDMQGETPLHKACRQGHDEVVRILIETGADPNVTNVYGMTPLHWVAITGRLDLSQLLLDHGADPHIRDEHIDGLTALDIARLMGYKDLVRLFEEDRVYL